MNSTSGSSQRGSRPGPATAFDLPRIRSRWAILGLSAATALLLSLIFAPISLWPLAYLCMVPWLVAICTTQRQTWLYGVSYLVGFAFFFFNLHWLWNVAFVQVGGWHLPAGTFGLSVYLAVYFPVSAWPIHHMCVRWRLPAALVFPVVWVANEMMRAWVMTGFPWFFLAHSHYRVLTMIQISDLLGGYGLSFVIAMVNGWLTDIALGWLAVRSRPWLQRRRMVAVSTLATAALLAATIGYGRYRLATERLVDGPRVAVIQEDFPLKVLDDGEGPYEQDKLSAHLKLAVQAAALRPDIIAFPETAWGDVLNRQFLQAEQLIPGEASRLQQRYSQTTDAILRALARGDAPAVNRHLAALQLGPLPIESLHPTYVLIGAFGYELFPTIVYPKIKKYNSAYLYEPTGQLDPQRYDKVHLVMFGEFVPFRYGRLHGFYKWLNGITPWGRSGREYSLTAGQEFKLLHLDAASQRNRTYSFGVPICYEDCMPYVCRAFVGHHPSGQRADFLLNISNDGWFNHGAEHVQHLAVCVFRAVENRVGIARAVNTGVSAFIDPLGRIYGPVTRGGKMIGQGVSGFSVETLTLSERLTPYTRFGDWFGKACCVLAGLMMAESVLMRLRRRWKRSGS